MNWFWWAFAQGGMVTVFVYARLWRRAEVLTDVELVELRYAGKPAAFLRGFRALYVALLINPIIIGWVTGAMLKVLKFTVFSGDVAGGVPGDGLDDGVVGLLVPRGRAGRGVGSSSSAWPRARMNGTLSGPPCGSRSPTTASVPGPG